METLTDMVAKNAPAKPAISFDRSDVERCLGLPAGQYTNPGFLLAFILGAILTVAFFGVLSLIPNSYFAVVFTQRGPVQYVTVFFTAWALSLLLVKALKVRVQSKPLRVSLLPNDDPGFILTPSSAEQVPQIIYRSVDDPKKFLLTHRVHNALANLRNMGQIGDVDDVLKTQAEYDEAVVDSGYTLLKGLIWAIPVLGFIGTVQGLSMALGSFWGVVSHAKEMDQLRDSLQGVTGGLATAFDTTLVGLIAAMAVHLLMILLRRREEAYLDACKEYCQRYIVGRLRLIRSSEATEK